MAKCIAREAIGADIAREYKNARSAEKQVWSHVLGMIADAATIDPVHAAGGCYCRECKYARKVDDREQKYKCVNICRDGCTQWLDSNDFCSYGVRREE